MIDQTRLIEVGFPLKQASLASMHEKDVRFGHISGLHIWPARRPLAACRAALLATLLPDPGDPEKRRELLEKIGGKVVTKLVEETDDDGNKVIEEKEVVEGGVLAWGNENAPAMAEFREMIREFYGGEAPKVLDPFAGGGAIPLEAMRLGCEVTASDLNPVAWLILKCTLDYPQQFAGKKWPLPDFVREWPDFVEDFLAGKVKKRKGNRKIHFSDPKQLQLIDLPEADLAWQVRAWGRWVLERARADLAPRYPVINGEPTVAYLWARTARDKTTLGRIPLLKTFWLRRKKGRRAALLAIPNPDKSGVTFRLLQDADLEKIERVISEYPFLKDWEITADNFISFLNAGTMNPAGVWSPVSGRPGMIALTKDELRRQGQQRLLGVQMTAVVVEATRGEGKRTFKRYRAQTNDEVNAATVEDEDLEAVYADIPFGLPAEPTPRGGGSGASRAFSLHNYGIKEWSDMFSRRQLLALGAFAKHSRAALTLIKRRGPKEAEAIGGYLAATFDRVADRSSITCSWTLDYDKIRNTFARFALPMCWDFAECVTTETTSGGYPGQLELVAQYIESALPGHGSPKPVTVQRMSALSETEEPFKLDAIVTDPPYYDAIPYSDLMDFFYVWLRRILAGSSAEIDSNFSEPVGPKWNHDENDGELIDDDSRFAGGKEASKRAYEDGMARAFERACGNLADIGRLLVVFANKSVDAWETLVGALVRGGAVVTASWPVQTERVNRTRGVASAALSSSIWIVCRKRPKTAVAGWEEQVVERMKQILFDPREALGDRNILQYYFDLGIRGPDLLWAALGPALEAYSAHPFVKKIAGGIMTVPEFLKEVRKLVLQFSLGELPGFRDVQQETRGRGESIELDPVTQYYLLHRNYFKLEPAPAGACILYANACGKNETELKLVWNILEQCGQSRRGRPRKQEDEDAVTEEAGSEGKGNEYRLVGWEQRASREGLGESKAGLPAPLIDRLHRLMFLFKQNRAADVQQLYEAWSLASDRAFKPLLQAARELAVRDKQDTERRLVEALATQLRMNRKTVIVENEVKDVPLFDAVER
jgi:adenine-specific DNA methylase